MSIVETKDAHLNYVITMSDKSTENHDMVITRCKDDFNAIAIAMRIVNSYLVITKILLLLR